MLLASPTQPNADTAAVATLKQKAANGELGSVFPGASVEVGGETVSVCESNCGSSDSDEDDGLKGWEIALIVIGVLLGVGLVSHGCTCDVHLVQIGAAGFFMYRKNQQNGVWRQSSSLTLVRWERIWRIARSRMHRFRKPWRSMRRSTRPMSRHSISIEPTCCRFAMV